MACSYPITIILEGRHELVPCGRCINCVQRKRAEWSFRLMLEENISENSTFLTLTYNDKNLPADSKFNKVQLQQYIKRVRTNSKNLKYYMVAERGEKNGRVHYHAIIFNADPNVLFTEWKNTACNNEALGFVSCDTVTEASIHYVTGYIVQKYGEMDEKTGKFGKSKNWTSDDLKPFAMMSKGLGKIYLKHNAKFHKDNFTTETIKKGGQRQLIPRYFRDKIFSEEERERLLMLLQTKMAALQKTGNIPELQKREYKKLVIKNLKNRKTL